MSWVRSGKCGLLGWALMLRPPEGSVDGRPAAQETEQDVESPSVCPEDWCPCHGFAGMVSGPVAPC